MYKSINDVRQEFLNFFQKKSHHIVSSSSLIPENDQTLLFTNSGMNQFKNVFLGIERPLFNRVVTVQNCMRAGGKHNDLDNVGFTDRHLTFFEMLGNFSFGDYFKNEAIQFAWELLTDRNWFNLSKDKIWVTTHICDDESYNIWKNHIGISKEHIIKTGNKEDGFSSDSDNFWKMGQFGPCGPCSEIFYDRGNSLNKVFNKYGKVFEERYLEIWNLVFIQYNRQIDGYLSPLSMLSVDTGMGLERITSILQGVSNNYCIDIFKNLIVSIFKIMQIKESTLNRSVYVLADHIRACVFLIKDGIIPSNEGRGYVLRRIIRRAICHGKKLGVTGIFLYKLITPVITCMKCLNNILCNQKDLIEQILFNEEKLFENTLQKGLILLNHELNQLKRNNILSGKVAFRLYSTYGFPLDLTKDVCHERNVEIDQSEFNRIMLEEKKFSKESSRFCTVYENIFPSNIITKFVGHDHLSYSGKVIVLLQDKKMVDILHPTNKESIIILTHTPFYGESGGQIGDIGYLKTTTDAVFKVTNTKKYGEVIVHIGIVSKGVITIDDQIFSEVDLLKRKQISINHTATHLLHAALLNVIGKHVIQRGSLISDQYLRFDFVHYNAITTTQLNDIENIINQKIWDNLSVISNNMSIESARKINAMMLPNKEYGKEVRVVRIGTFSTEMCGGTHIECTREIGLFIVSKEFGIGSGVRRIEAITKNTALSFVQQKKELLENIITIIHSDTRNVLNKVHEFKLNCNKLEKEVKILRDTQELQKVLLLIKDTVYIKDIPVLIQVINDITLQSVFKIISHLRCRLKLGVVILIQRSKSSNKLHIVINVDKDLVEFNRINALELVQCMIRDFGGKGGGRSDFAQISIDNVITVSSILMKMHTLLNTIL